MRLAAVFLAWALTASAKVPVKTEPCAKGHELLARPVFEKGEKFFSSNIDVRDVARQLDLQAFTFFENAEPVIVKLDGDHTLAIKAGREMPKEDPTARPRYLLKLEMNGREVAQATFEFTKSYSLFLNSVKTKPFARQQGASDALIQIILANQPQITEIRAKLAMTNVEVIAEKLTGKENLSNEHQEIALTKEFEGDPEKLIAAIEESPTGKSLKRAGFHVDRDALDVFPMEDLAPRIELKWRRPLKPTPPGPPKPPATLPSPVVIPEAADAPEPISAPPSVQPIQPTGEVPLPLEAVPSKANSPDSEPETVELQVEEPVKPQP